LVDLPEEIGWIGINDGRVAKNPIIAEGVQPVEIAYHNGSMPGILSSVHVIPKTRTAIVVLGNTLSFADLPDYIGGMILETLLDAPNPTDFLSLVEEAKTASLQGPLKTARKLEDERISGTAPKPLAEYKGGYVNSSGIFRLDVDVHGEGLRVHLQGLPLTYYNLSHYHDDTFAWPCDRDAEAKRAMFPQLSDAFRKIEFHSDSSGKIDRIHWIYARDEPAGEVFYKAKEDVKEHASM